MINAFPNLILSARDMPYINCLTCGRPMKMMCAESVAEDFDLRAYECDQCEIGETFVVQT